MIWRQKGILEWSFLNARFWHDEFLYVDKLDEIIQRI